MFLRSAAACAPIVAAGLLAAPALGQPQQTDYEAIVRIMRECAQIPEVEARVACYDNTVHAERLIAGSDAARPQTPAAVPEQPRPEQAGAPQAASSRDTARVPQADAQRPPASVNEGARGFGAESVPQPASTRRAEREVDEVELGVAQAQRVEPGIYILTLEDGSQWRFVDAVPFSYDPPRDGSRIELTRAALGSFQMRFENQRPVRIMRVQ